MNLFSLRALWTRCTYRRVRASIAARNLFPGTGLFPIQLMVGFVAGSLRPKIIFGGFRPVLFVVLLCITDPHLMPISAIPAMPVIGFLDSQSRTFADIVLPAFRQGLNDNGYVEGENIAIEYRWAKNQVDRLPALANDLVRRGVALIVAGAPPATLAAKAATTTIPIVFGVGHDPVKIGLVASLARPGGNLTGINFFSSELAAKRMQLIREMVPAAARVAVLGDPTFTLTESQVTEAKTAARAMGLQIQVLNASTSREINAAFANFVRERPDALYVGTGPFFVSRRVQLAHLATRHAVPAIYSGRQYTEAGGLMSYGTSLTDAYRQMGAYTGRILKGAKPADLPVIQSTKFELIINVETARMLDLTVPDKLLAAADEVIE
jgi:putative ABC transport system substrate-binding protein